MTARTCARWLGRSVLALIVLALLGTLSSQIVLAQPPEPHQYIEDYEGPATCQVCHGNVTKDVVHSVHYTWDNKLDHYSTVAATTTEINWLSVISPKLDIAGGCGRCHIGSGALPTAPDEITAEDKAGIDCLICHSPSYDISLRFPVESAAGNWSLTQDRRVLAARQAQRPTTENCLLCHQNVGGGTMLKNGIELASDTHGEFSKPDVHLDAGMTCVDCHASQDHKIAGYSPNLWSRDLPDQRLTCESCHTATPHGNSILDTKHTRLDCRSCHITGTGGLVARDWTAEPKYDPVTRLYSPVDDIREANSVQPTLLWYDGTEADAAQVVSGSRRDDNSRLQPFKIFNSTAPVDAKSGAPIPLKLDLFYRDGDLSQAIAQGADEAGMDYSGQWEPGAITATLQLSHGIVPKENARACQECHAPDGLVDFTALGYKPEEATLLASLTGSGVTERRPLQNKVVIPAAQPLPTPVSLSGQLEAARGFGIRIPWNPLLVALVSALILAGGFYWLWRQRPKPLAVQPTNEQTPPDHKA